MDHSFLFVMYVEGTKVFFVMIYPYYCLPISCESICSFLMDNLKRWIINITKDHTFLAIMTLWWFQKDEKVI